MAWAEQQVRNTSCILCTDSIDSRGGYDAVLVNESPMLGLSNLRAALQALQLRESLDRTNCHLRWLASDYDVGDALTKKRPCCWIGLQKSLKARLWCVAFDPTFTAARKNAQRGKSAISAIDSKRSQSDICFWSDATDSHPALLSDCDARFHGSRNGLLVFMRPDPAMAD